MQSTEPSTTPESTPLGSSSKPQFETVEALLAHYDQFVANLRAKIASYSAGEVEFEDDGIEATMARVTMWRQDRTKGITWVIGRVKEQE